MRLFISINFNEQIKNSLCDIEQRLKQNAVSGNFTCRENLHLTLVFIGETTKPDVVEQVMDLIQSSSFLLKIKGFGYFKRNAGNIYWVGVEKSDKLSYIYHQLFDGLVQMGFSLEKRDFKPHLTLGRKVVLQSGFSEKAFAKNISSMEMPVQKISLMKSERINNRQVYTQLYTKQLQ